MPIKHKSCYKIFSIIEKRRKDISDKKILLFFLLYTGNDWRKLYVDFP